LPPGAAVYKLTYNIDVAEIEQQVQDYIRQEVRVRLHHIIGLTGGMAYLTSMVT